MVREVYKLHPSATQLLKHLKVSSFNLSDRLLQPPNVNPTHKATIDHPVIVVCPKHPLRSRATG